MNTPDVIIAFSTAATALITSLANGIVLVIKAAKDRQVNQAVSHDIVKLAANGGNTAHADLQTPKLVEPAPEPAPATATLEDSQPGGSPG